MKVNLLKSKQSGKSNSIFTTLQQHCLTTILVGGLGFPGSAACETDRPGMLCRDRLALEIRTKLDSKILKSFMHQNYLSLLKFRCKNQTVD